MSSPPPAVSETGDKLLLTPGPLTTSAAVKQAMLHDWGSRDAAFIRINREVLERLTELAGGGDDTVTVPLQGSGTFAVEAMISNFVPRQGKLLLLVNGAYGKRAKRIAEIAGLAHEVMETAEHQPPSPVALAARLEAEPEISHVFLVHCETTSGILNPLPEIAQVTRRYERALLVDAMSAFGAIAIDARRLGLTALAASSNKCLEGVPGLGFVICRKDALAATAGNAKSLALDLHDQWSALEKTGQWRFTPPIHVIAALHQALAEHRAEGGVAGRCQRYTGNCRLLVEGMRQLGFQTLLPDGLQAPIIVTFHMPADRNFAFQTFYDRLKELGYVIYPGKLTVADSFRIGCIGHIGRTQIEGALKAIRMVLAEMHVSRLAPELAA